MSSTNPSTNGSPRISFFTRKSISKNQRGLEQQVRGVQVRLECRCIEELKPKPVYLEVTEGFSDSSKKSLLTSIQDGKVRGTTEAETEGTILILVPVGLRQVAILHKSTNRYLAMNIQGKLHTTPEFNGECKFKENVYENYWCVYSSLKYQHPESRRFQAWHIGIKHVEHKDTYKAVRGPKARKNRPVSHFLPHFIAEHMMFEPQELSSYSINPSRSSTGTYSEP